MRVLAHRSRWEDHQSMLMDSQAESLDAPGDSGPLICRRAGNGQGRT